MSDPSPVAADGRDPRRVNVYFLAPLVVALALAAWGEIGRVKARNSLAEETANDATSTVVTVNPTRTDLGEELILPGTVQAFVEAPIYARTNGYLKTWYTDIGSTVKRGQLLAEIDTPEVDQQLAQAIADLATARANETLSNTTNARWKELLETESVSKQDAEEKAGDSAAKKATAAAAVANVSRLRELESFKRVVAPFDGIITARNTDIGALINAGQSAGYELFRLADTHKLRIYVQVPEPYASAAKPGLEAQLRFSEQQGKSYTATVVRTSNALDPGLRTLQVELQLDNAKRELFPGAYAEAHFKLPGEVQSLRLPANTVLFRAQGLQVATVDGHHRIQLKSIVEGRDFGNSIEVLSGLDADDAVVINPPDSIVSGAIVRVADPPPEQAPKGHAKAT
jgi:RND family efflux transporter MFP subunit